MYYLVSYLRYEEELSRLHALVSQMSLGGCGVCHGRGVAEQWQERSRFCLHQDSRDVLQNPAQSSYSRIIKALLNI